MRFFQHGKLGIVIPVHNGLGHLPGTLQVLRRSDWPSSVVVVVDDGSTDGTAEFLESVPDVIVVRGNGALWWSGAANQGTLEAMRRGVEAVIVWNDDNVNASTACIRTIAQSVFRTRGCASPVVLQEGKESASKLRHAGGGLNWRAGGLYLASYGDTYQPSSSERTVPWLPGNALGFSVTLFEALNGFDAQSFPQYRGDADFTLRAVSRGASCEILLSDWVSNDARRTGLAPGGQLSMTSFVNGLTSRRSNDQVSSTVRFALRHCPKRYIFQSLLVYYLKYCYCVLKMVRARHTPSSA